VIKRLLLTGGMLMLAVSGSTAPASAARWCSVQNLGDLSENCYFTSRRQCQASLTGHTDFCRPYYGRGHRSETNGSGSMNRRW
jgi:hypothetical protein